MVKKAKKNFVMNPGDQAFKSGQQFELKVESSEFVEKKMDWDDEPKDYLSILGSTDFTDEFHIDVRYSEHQNSYYYKFITALAEEAEVDMKEFEAKDLEGETILVEKRDLEFGKNRETGEIFKKDGACLIIGIKE